MIYKLKEHVTDEMLEELGFFDNRLDYGKKKYPIEVTEDKEYEASKWFPKEKVCVAVSKIMTMGKYVTDIEVYRYKGIETNHKKISNVRNYIPYIQDLIDLNYVEVVE
jgi:hypothetical protein